MSSVPHKMRLVSNQITRVICQRYTQTFGIYPVLEYPKCGGTWLCRMLADTLQLPFAQFSAMPVAMPSVVHGHWTYHKGYRNVTFLVRDGRDVMVSFYFHFTRIQHTAKSPKFRRALDNLYGHGADLSDVRTNLPRFIEYINKHPIGAPTDWSTYHNQWIDKPNVVYTRYEALRSDCIAEMTRVTAEHGVACDEWRIERAVDGHSMQRAAGRKPGEEDRSSFIRKGVVGDWKNHFSDEALEVFADQCGETLVALGYETSNDWKSWGRQPDHTDDPQTPAAAGQATQEASA